MPNWSQFLRRATIALAIGLIVCGTPSSAFAQKGKDKDKEEEVKGYTLPYFFTLIGGLAVVVPIGMACKRKWDLDREDEEDAA